MLSHSHRQKILWKQNARIRLTLDRNSDISFEYMCFNYFLFPCCSGFPHIPIIHTSQLWRAHGDYSFASVVQYQLHKEQIAANWECSAQFPRKYMRKTNYATVLLETRNVENNDQKKNIRCQYSSRVKYFLVFFDFMDGHKWIQAEPSALDIASKTLDKKGWTLVGSSAMQENMRRLKIQSRYESFLPLEQYDNMWMLCEGTLKIGNLALPTQTILFTFGMLTKLAWFWPES